MMRLSLFAMPALAALLAACQTNQGTNVPSPLPAHALACRSEASLATLHAAGSAFQRAADAELASGRCRRFAAGSGVLNLQPGGFVDPANGQTYLIFR